MCLYYSNSHDVQQKKVTFETERSKPACVAVARPMPQNGRSSPLPPHQQQQQNGQQTTLSPIMQMTQQNYAEQLNNRVVQQSQTRNCNDILAAKPQTK